MRSDMRSRSKMACSVTF